MSVSRRRFLRTAALVSAAFAVKPATAALGKNFPSSTVLNRAQGQAKAGSNSVYSYNREMFEPYIGDVFRVRVGEKTVDLKLVDLTAVEPVSDDITTGTTARTDCFALLFHANESVPETANVPQLSHAQLGTFDLFMTQSGNGRRFVQTAVINHLI